MGIQYRAALGRMGRGFWARILAAAGVKGDWTGTRVRKCLMPGRRAGISSICVCCDQWLLLLLLWMLSVGSNCNASHSNCLCSSARSSTPWEFQQPQPTTSLVHILFNYIALISLTLSLFVLRAWYCCIPMCDACAPLDAQKITSR
jgi:hypothetical protein